MVFVGADPGKASVKGVKKLRVTSTGLSGLNGERCLLKISGENDNTDPAFVNR